MTTRRFLFLPKMSDIDFWAIDPMPDQGPPQMTKDEFIEKAKIVLRKIMDGYSRHWKDHFDESEENQCSRCSGFTQIIQGGEIADCPSCKGTGMNSERVFDIEGFSEFIEHEVLFGELPFLELLECEILKDENLKAKGE